MKNSFLKIIVMLMLGVFGAFAVNKAPVKTEGSVDLYGHNPANCMPTDVLCTDENTGIICSNGTLDLTRYDGPSFCPEFLYKKF